MRATWIIGEHSDVLRERSAACRKRDGNVHGGLLTWCETLLVERGRRTAALYTHLADLEYTITSIGDRYRAMNLLVFFLRRWRNHRAPRYLVVHDQAWLRIEMLWRSNRRDDDRHHDDEHVARSL